jgi:hypothetical protein
MRYKGIVYEVEKFLIMYVSSCGSNDVGMKGRAKYVTARTQSWERQLCALRRNIILQFCRHTQFLRIPELRLSI